MSLMRDHASRLRATPSSKAAAHPHSHVLMSTSFGPPEFLERWADTMRAHGVTVQTWPDGITDLTAVELAVVFDPPPGLLARCPNLRAVHSMGAGVSPGMLDDDAVCPAHLPLLRVADPLMAQRMAGFCLWAVLNAQRKCDAYLAAQRAQRWDKGVENFRQVDAADWRVGVMGLGHMGAATADLLLAAGYPVNAWTRGPRPERGSVGAGARCFHGADQLREFAASSNVVVCLVPLTPETRGILNAEFFGRMPRGGTVVNVSRGSHLVVDDLLAALDRGHLAGAVLDVFDEEPLAADSPLWHHPQVRVFPHISSTPHLPSAVALMLENRAAILEGRPLPPHAVVDRQRGY